MGCRQPLGPSPRNWTAASQHVANGAGQLKHGAESSRLRVTEAIDLKVHGGIVEGVPHGEFVWLEFSGAFLATMGAYARKRSDSARETSRMLR